MRCLVYQNEDGQSGCWIAHNDSELDLAFGCLFKLLDANGCYDWVPVEFRQCLREAREGAVRQIKALLRMRHGQKNETWHVLQVEDMAEFELVCL